MSTQATGTFKIDSWDEEPHGDDGYLRVDGDVGGRSGSVVFQSTGAFDGSEAAGPLTIVPGTGTGELAGITGGGTFRAPMGGEPALSLDYDFEGPRGQRPRGAGARPPRPHVGRRL